MAGMMTVELKKVRFFAFHGLYPEERKTGNEFDVSLSVSWDPAEKEHIGIADTVNYAVLFEIVKEQMLQPVGLLETVVAGIAGRIKTTFPQTKKVLVRISKIHPPIAGFSGSISVSFEKDY
jgi:dihydroneopterin aldolase